MVSKTSPRTVLVGGATGHQGGAVVNELLARGHKAVAYVRSADSLKAQALANRGITLVEGDLADVKTLTKAMAGVDAVFSITVPFGESGIEGEIAQGKALADAAAQQRKHLVYSSVAGANVADKSVGHVNSKQVIEEYINSKDVTHTILGPVYLMENLLNFDFNQLRRDVYALPLSPGRKIDQTTVLDIASLAVYAIENPDEMIGQRVDLASDSVSGQEIVDVLTEVLGRTITYYQMPIEQVRQFAGDEVATMFQKFEEAPYHIDLQALHSRYPEVQWHSFAEWAKTLDWDKLLPKSQPSRSSS